MQQARAILVVLFGVALSGCACPGKGPLCRLRSTLIDARQSSELDRAKRLKLVWEIQKKVEADVARPMLGWRKEYFVAWPHVKNLVSHNRLYNWARMQEVWLDK